jgi:hypothetical protein
LLIEIAEVSGDEDQIDWVFFKPPFRGFMGDKRPMGIGEKEDLHRAIEAAVLDS